MTTAITNYTTLKAALVAWVRNSGLTGDEDGMIQLCEAKLNRRLRTRSMDTVTTSTLTAASDSISFPTRCIEVQSVSILSGSSWLEMEPLTSDDLDSAYSSTSGTPAFYTITDGIEFDCPALTSQSIQVRYWKALDIASDTTNWVLTNAADLYLYGSLTAAGGFLREDQRLADWKALFDEGVQELNTSQARAASNGMEMRTELHSRGYDINTDR